MIDEVELQDYLSSARGCRSIFYSVDQISSRTQRGGPPKSRQPVVDKAFSAVGDAAIVAQELSNLPAQRWEGEFPASLAGPLSRWSVALANWRKPTTSFASRVLRQWIPTRLHLQSARGQPRNFAAAINMVRTPTRRLFVGLRSNVMAVLSCCEQHRWQSVARFASGLGRALGLATSATACVAGDFAPLAVDGSGASTTAPGTRR